MSKRKKSRRGHVTSASRSLDERHPLRRVMPDDPLHKPTFETVRRQPDLKPVEDLRRVPQEIDKREAFRLRDGRPARQERRPESKVSVPRLSTPMHDYFSDPRRTIVCIRRHLRKRVLFALRKAGKGKKVSPLRKFTDKSFVRCK